MKNEKINDIFLNVIFVLCTLIQVDMSMFGIDVKTMLVSASVLVFLVAKLVTDKGFPDVKTDHIDIVVYVSGGFALAGMLYKLVLQPEGYGKYMTLLSLCLLYFAARNYVQDIRADMIFRGSIWNAVISLLLLCHFVVDADFVMPVSALFREGGILPWLILATSINVLGFCVYDGKEIWYGTNAVVDFFLLFIQDNAAATVMAGSMFLQTALRYMTRKKTVKRVTQMFFTFVFLLCNMALITNYTGLLTVNVSYNLELGVYLELILAVFGVWFFQTWDKDTDGHDEEDRVLPQFRGFFKKVSVAVSVVLVTAAAAVVRGTTMILPDVFGKLIALCLQGVETQTGMLEMAAAVYGNVGVMLVGYFMYGVLDTLRRDRLLRTSRHRKLFRIVSWVFVTQALVLTQSMASMPLYIIFVAVMLNEHHTINEDTMERLSECSERDKNDDGTKDQMKGEKAYETDHTDPMLQRGRNIGNRVKRFTQKAGWRRPD